MSPSCNNMCSDLLNHAAQIFNEAASPTGHLTQHAKCQREMLRESKCSQHSESINTRQNACWDMDAIYYHRKLDQPVRVWIKDERLKEL